MAASHFIQDPSHTTCIPFTLNAKLLFKNDDVHNFLLQQSHQTSRGHDLYVTHLNYSTKFDFSPAEAKILFMAACRPPTVPLFHLSSLLNALIVLATICWAGSDTCRSTQTRRRWLTALRRSTLMFWSAFTLKHSATIIYLALSVFQKCFNVMPIFTFDANDKLQV